MICEGLETDSFSIKNDVNERLYATFVRIRIHGDQGSTLRSFKESNSLTFSGDMNRYGNSMYFSNIDMKSLDIRYHAELMTTFSIREKVDNTKLSKAEPDSATNKIEVAEAFPTFGNEYRLMKKKVLNEVSAHGMTFSVAYDADLIYENQYELNPFYDINGVNLLYFAAYPIINDCCEANYFKPKIANWLTEYYTAYKDVFYYANCNLDDSIIYQLVSSEKFENEYRNTSILRRVSDNAIIAKVFSVKRKLS